MDKKAYARGFAKCSAALGVDPNMLVKAAESGPMGEYTGAMITRALPMGTAVSAIGGVAGLLDSNNDYKSESTLANIIPGVGHYRLAKRERNQVAREMKDIEENPEFRNAKPIGHATSEFIGPITSVVLAGIAGTAIGGINGVRKSGVKGGLVGSGKGLLKGIGYGTAANMAGMLAAAITRRRTAREQLESDSDNLRLAAKFVVPGLASYDEAKRIGRSQGDRDEGRV